MKLWKYDLWPYALVTVNSIPAQEFRFETQSLAWSYALGGFSHGEMSGWCIWDMENGSWFGVEIWVPSQYLYIGTAPYYRVCWSETPNNEWHTPVDDPATPFTFPTSTGYQVEIKTVCGHTSIDATITVKKAKVAPGTESTIDFAQIPKPGPPRKATA